MVNDPDTRESLLLRIADARDRDAWMEFAEIYEPVIYRLGMAKGLQDADARDLIQAVMSRVARSIHRWQPDREQATFRTWLSRVTHNAFIDLLRERHPDTATGGTSVMQRLKQQPQVNQAERAAFEFEHRRAVFRWAMRRIRGEFAETTWQAFSLTTLDGLSPTEAAAKLQISLGNVYTSRSRIIRRLKVEVQRHDTDV